MCFSLIESIISIIFYPLNYKLSSFYIKKRAAGHLCPAALPSRRVLPGSSGGDLLSHFRSTIGAVRFNFSVRNGKRWSPHAISALISFGGVRPPYGRRGVGLGYGSDLKTGTSVRTRAHEPQPRTNAAPAYAGPRDGVFAPVSASDPPGAGLAFAFQKRVRAISTARLRTLPRFHLPPIYVVVSDDPLRRSYLGVGFALRCFQRLSCPDADTRQCPWRDNR